MLKAIQKVPAGTFLIPMLLGLIVGNIWPNLFSTIGGMSEALFSSSAASTMVAMVTFASGASIDIKKLGPVLKRHGSMFAIKIVWGTPFVLAFFIYFWIGRCFRNSCFRICNSGFEHQSIGVAGH